MDSIPDKNRKFPAGFLILGLLALVSCCANSGSPASHPPPPVLQDRPLARQVPISPEDKARARKHFTRGYAHYQKGKYLVAIRELKLAFRIQPLPVLQFYIAQTFQAARLYDEAVRAYERYLRTARPDHAMRPKAEYELIKVKKAASLIPR